MLLKHGPTGELIHELGLISVGGIGRWASAMYFGIRSGPMDAGLIVTINFNMTREIDADIQNDMLAAMMMMLGPLGKSITCGTSPKEKWCTHESNFQISEHGLTSGCINLSLGWFLQAHLAPQFQPKVSATLKSDDGTAYCWAMCRLAALVAAALRVMHSSLYWSSLTTQLGLGVWGDTHQAQTIGTWLREWASVFTVVAIICNRIGGYTSVRMKMPNIGIEIAYNPGVMASTLGRIVRHGVNWVNSDQVGWMWYMRDDIHEFVDVPQDVLAIDGSIRRHFSSSSVSYCMLRDPLGLPVNPVSQDWAHSSCLM
ncbi:hypothetical protein C8R48DRAFT_677149 [Suillus tomentosus]|nr:hypothetical protein C8R48DRAFT_677149 [Suillus tomentosus]